MASFLVVLDSGEQKLVASEKNSLRIGRRSDNEIFLDEIVVSRDHAEVYFDKSRYYVRDAGSRNGTFVNNQCITHPAELSPGDIIGVGSAKIVFEPAESVCLDQGYGLSETAIIMRHAATPLPKEPEAPFGLLQTVADITSQIAQKRPLEALLDSLLNLCVTKTSAQRAAILLFDDKGELAPRAYLSRAKLHPRFVISRSIAQKAIDQNQAILIEDVLHDESLKQKESVIGLEIKSAICTPMRSGEQTLGVLYVDTSKPGCRFGETDLVFFSSLAGLIADKIDEAILWPWEIKIYTFGRFVLIKDEKMVSFTGKAQKKPIELLKALIAFGGRDVSEERLVDALWPDAEGDLGHQTFNTTLHRLRKIIGKATILMQGGRVTLNPSLCWVDAWAFERLLGEAEPRWRREEPEHQSQAAHLTEKAMDMNFAPFLRADREQEWTVAMRERLRSKFLRNVSRLGGYLEKAGKTEKALEIYRKGLEMDPLAEELYHKVMLCHLKLGSPAQAKKTYQRCRKILLTELGLDPSEKIKAVAKSLGSDPEQDDSFES